ncbi:protein-L-isoaspartate O-methyltransferase [Streptomyces sp. NBC_01142]|uniref:protein-L-isoaspartate O-methyltransferase n=1 Tax=Streptomyces sp. NBC_01142 TaxID=2975865 RepID=UPI002258E25F|nr:protein-L-isoaspartate O-methyltransferase [Streptomyces sp. NBC_01142]MCX4821342.1 protein-L-isoaspartate O-methyltransferase [Streptomyces sp. NBC_01142]
MRDPSPPVTDPTAETTARDRVAAARAAMVARLEASGDLSPGQVRDALLTLPRERLMPQAYVRRSAPDETPPRWALLEWAVAENQEELLGVLYGGDSVLIQHDDESILEQLPGPRSGGSITSMSSTVAMTAGLLQLLDLRPGQRVLDVGTGAGVTAAVACWVCGDAGVVTLDRDPHVSAAAGARLSDLGHTPVVVTGDGAAGWSEQAPYDRVFVSYAVPRFPWAWVAQLASGGLALANLSTTSPSWPGLAVVAKTPKGRVEAELRAVEFGHRPVHGFDRIFLSAMFRDRIAAGGGLTTHSRTAPPSDRARGMWLALDHLHPGLVRNWAADHLVIGAPACGSWLTVRPDRSGGWAFTAAGPRGIRDEIQDTAARWQAAGEPETYRLHLASDGTQQVSAGAGPNELSWALPAANHRDDETGDSR